jgi:hypothetical protein
LVFLHTLEAQRNYPGTLGCSEQDD